MYFGLLLIATGIFNGCFAISHARANKGWPAAGSGFASGLSLMIGAILLITELTR